MTTKTEQGYAERLLAALKAAGPLEALTAGDIVEAVLGVRDDELDRAHTDLERLRRSAETAVAGALRQAADSTVAAAVNELRAARRRIWPRLLAALAQAAASRRAHRAQNGDQHA